MSFSLEMKVNGHPVVVIVGNQAGYAGSPDLHSYNATGMFLEMGGAAKLITLTEVLHNYDDGLLVLCSKVLAEAVRENART